MSETFTWPGYDESDPVHRQLHGFLVLDLQYDPQRAAELLAGVRDYRCGRCAEVSGSGNGYDYECTPGGLELVPLYDEDEEAAVLVGYDTLECALGAWAEHCRVQVNPQAQEPR